MVHLSSFRKVKAFGRTNFISSTGCPSEHPEQRNGFENTNSGGASVILGGSNNVVTHDCASVVGFNLASVADNTLHVNCLNAVDTPLAFAFAPSGTVMYKTFATLTATDRVLVIAP
jgi:hypothetical protein